MQMKALKNISLGAVARGWAQITAMALTLMAARTMSKEDFGIYAIASVLTILLSGLMYGGVYDYIIKTRSEELDINTCFWMNFGFGVFGAVATAILAPVAGYLSHATSIMVLMLALAPSVVVASVASWQEALLLRQGRLLTYYRLSVIIEALGCLCGIMSLLNGAGVWAFVVYRYVQLGLGAGLYLLIVRQLPRLSWNAALAQTVFSFSQSIYLSRILGTIANYGADILLGFLISPAAAGVYRLGGRVVLGVSEIAYQPTSTAAWVHFAATDRDGEALAKEYLNLTTVLALLIWPALGSLAVLSKIAVHLAVGPGWDDAVPVIVLLAGARMFALFEVLLDPLLGVCNRTGTIMIIRSAVAVGLLLAVAMLARFGAIGAAAAMLAVWALLAVTAVSVCLRVMPLRLGQYMRAVAPGLLGTVAAMCGASAAYLSPALPNSLVLQAIMTVTCGTIAWASVLCLLYRRSFERRIRGFRNAASL